jgi:hypothetical protein
MSKNASVLVSYQRARRVGHVPLLPDHLAHVMTDALLQSCEVNSLERATLFQVTMVSTGALPRA